MALFGAASSTPATSGTGAQGDISKDVPVKDPPEDSISGISFSPTHDYLAVSSWDKKVRIYDIDSQGNSRGLAMWEHDGPALCVCWSKDGRYVVSGGADNKAKMFDTQNQSAGAQQVAQHDGPIRCVQMFQSGGQNMLVTGSWDKTIKYWNLTSAQPVGSVTVSDRVYTMDVAGNALVVGMADRWVEIFNLEKPSANYKKLQSPLKWQTRVVSCFPDSSGFAVGSIEGRCAIQYIEDKDSSLNFSFKCHRQNDPNNASTAKVFSVNAISFHPQHGTFSTAGSDGTYHFWDKDAKHRLKGYPEVGGSIVATTFNKSGTIFAYAISYDWSQGFSKNNPNYPNKIMLHPIVGDECKPRAGAKKR